jgi:hypothetical protein
MRVWFFMNLQREEQKEDGFHLANPHLMLRGQSTLRGALLAETVPRVFPYLAKNMTDLAFCRLCQFALEKAVLARGSLTANP